MLVKEETVPALMKRPISCSGPRRETAKFENEYRAYMLKAKCRGIEWLKHDNIMGASLTFVFGIAWLRKNVFIKGCRDLERQAHRTNKLTNIVPPAILWPVDKSFAQLLTRFLRAINCWVKFD